MAARDSAVDMPAREIVVERVLDAPRERVFEVFTRSEHMPGHGALVTVTLEERDGRTLLTLRGVYRSRADRDAVIASGMEWGARLSYLQLDEVLDEMRRSRRVES